MFIVDYSGAHLATECHAATDEDAREFAEAYISHAFSSSSERSAVSHSDVARILVILTCRITSVRVYHCAADVCRRVVVVIPPRAGGGGGVVGQVVR
jgi:hypothetical protein